MCLFCAGWQCLWHAAHRYAVGVKGSIECPAGAVKIRSASDCGVAAAALGLMDSAVAQGSDTTKPPGCILTLRHDGSRELYYNTHFSGAAHWQTSRVCQRRACFAASTVYTNGNEGDCGDYLAAGASCQPQCDGGFMVSGTTTCTAGRGEWQVISGGDHCSIDGMCVTDGDGNYGSNEDCEFNFVTNSTFTLVREEWAFESISSSSVCSSSTDYLSVDGTKYCAYSTSHSRALPASKDFTGTTMFRFHSDSSSQYAGFRVCASDGLLA